MEGVDIAGILELVLGFLGSGSSINYIPGTPA